MSSQPPSHDDPETAQHWRFISNIDNSDDTNSNARCEEIKTTPLFSSSVRLAAKEGRLGFEREGNVPIHPQYGLLGARVETYGRNDDDIADEEVMERSTERDLIYSNTTAPHSTFICGSQGVGKSHTLSCILENSLLSPCRTGALKNPLSAIMFHYDQFTSSSTTQVCESAYLCSSGIPVRVLVSPSNYDVMEKLYTNLPGLPADAPKPEVHKLYFSEKQLNITMMKTLMAVGGGEGPVPLYLEVVSKILRDMARESQGAPGINYALFKRRLQEQPFTGAQNGPLNMRLALLESFLDQTVSGMHTASDTDIWSFKKGSLTIVDLSCTFVQENDACALFNLCLSLFLENRSSGGRLVALDEAHKFLTTNSREAISFTEGILSLIRQQRHLATRVVIATQEPTLSPSILDLCNVSIVHRFTSPAWFKALEGHLAGACLGVADGEGGSDEMFRKIVKLRTGEAFVFCPSAILDLLTIKSRAERSRSSADRSSSEGSGEVVDEEDEGNESDGIDEGATLEGPAVESDSHSEEEGSEGTESTNADGEEEHARKVRVQELGARYIRLKVRNRVTADGGRSILAV
ncbi:hypothetical protein FQN54_008083 [Arachnomyces sp. PD_36]|nr:hypothetical protein FQN54_008083 [Arachnomyces sp. PD_36]